MFHFLAVFVIDDVLMWVAVASMVAGAATSFVGAQQSAKAAEDAGKAQAKAQAKAAEAQARNEELQGAEAIKRERINNRRRLARLRADHGTTGVVMGDSSMDVFAETAGAMELQIQDAARASAMEASNIRQQGAMAQWEARTQATATRMSAVGTLLSNTSDIAGFSVKSGLIKAPKSKISGLIT